MRPSTASTTAAAARPAPASADPTGTGASVDATTAAAAAAAATAPTHHRRRAADRARGRPDRRGRDARRRRPPAAPSAPVRHRACVSSSRSSPARGTGSRHRTEEPRRPGQRRSHGRRPPPSAPSATRPADQGGGHPGGHPSRIVRRTETGDGEVPDGKRVRSARTTSGGDSAPTAGRAAACARCATSPAARRRSPTSSATSARPTPPRRRACCWRSSGGPSTDDAAGGPGAPPAAAARDPGLARRWWALGDAGRAGGGRRHRRVPPHPALPDRATARAGWRPTSCSTPPRSCAGPSRRWWPRRRPTRRPRRPLPAAARPRARVPIDHPAVELTEVLADAVAAGIVDRDDAELIARSRIGGHRVADIARASRAPPPHALGPAPARRARARLRPAGRLTWGTWCCCPPGRGGRPVRWRSCCRAAPTWAPSRWGSCGRSSSTASRPDLIVGCSIGALNGAALAEDPTVGRRGAARAGVDDRGPPRGACPGRGCRRRWR